MFLEKVFSTILNVNEIEEIISAKLKQKQESKIDRLGIYFEVKDFSFGKYAILVSNRLEVDCFLIISDEPIFFDLLKFWIETPGIACRVEPFWSVVKMFVKKHFCNDSRQVFTDRDDKEVIQLCLQKLPSGFMNSVYRFLEKEIGDRLGIFGFLKNKHEINYLK